MKSCKGPGGQGAASTVLPVVASPPTRVKVPADFDPMQQPFPPEICDAVVAKIKEVGVVNEAELANLPTAMDWIEKIASLVNVSTLRKTLKSCQAPSAPFGADKPMIATLIVDCFYEEVDE